MTFTPVEDFTPAQHVAKALFKLVNIYTTTEVTKKSNTVSHSF